MRPVNLGSYGRPLVRVETVTRGKYMRMTSSHVQNSDLFGL